MQRAQMHAIVRAVPDLDGLAAPVLADGRIKPVERVVEFGHALGGGEPVGQPHGIVGEPVQRRHHLHEGRRRLHERAQRHLAGQIFGRSQQQWNHRRQHHVGADQPRHAPLLDHHAIPAHNNVAQRLVEAFALVLVAADQRDGFRAVLDAGQLVAQLRLSRSFFFHAAHERGAQQIHRSAGQRGIDNAGDDQITGHIKAADFKPAADEPQHADERHRSQHRVEHAQREINQQLNAKPRIVGHARLGVLGVAADNAELIKAPLRKPARKQGFGQPFAPAYLQPHPQMQKAGSHGG